MLVSVEDGPASPSFLDFTLQDDTSWADSWLQWFAELVPVVGRRFSYSFRYVWQGSGRILDTTPDSSVKGRQEVVDFNVQVPGDSNNVRGRPESCGHPILEKKKRNRLPNGRTRSFRGLACSFSCPLPGSPARSTLGSWKCLLTSLSLFGSNSHSWCWENSPEHLLDLPASDAKFESTCPRGVLFLIATPCLCLFLHSVDNCAKS